MTGKALVKRKPSDRAADGPAGRPQSPFRRPKPAVSRVSMIVVSLFLLPAGVLFLPTTLLLAVGLIPTLVALVVDRSPEKYAAITVGPLNFCGVLPAALELWQGSHTVEHTLRLITDPLTLLVACSAAGVGWLVFYVVPPLVAGIVVAHHEQEIKRARDHQEKLSAEWGEDVAAGLSALTTQSRPPRRADD